MPQSWASITVTVELRNKVRDAANARGLTQGELIELALDHYEPTNPPTHPVLRQS